MSVSKSYDIDGKEIDIKTFYMYCDDRFYGCVAKTTLRNNNVVSSYWTGKHRSTTPLKEGDLPLIFETRVYNGKELEIVFSPTLKDTFEDHAKMVIKWWN